MKLEGRDHTLAVKPDNLDPESLDPRKLRFGLGDRVACNCSNEGWERGKVVQLLYSEMGTVIHTKCSSTTADTSSPPPTMMT